MTVRYTPEAIRDLQELRYYIRKVLGNPKAAQRIAIKILDACSNLKSHPQLGPSLEVKTGSPTDLRYLLCEKYIAIYRIEGNIVSVSRILDGRQDYLHILFASEQ